jgi:phage tail-like protein
MSGYYPPVAFQFAVTLLPRSLTGIDAAFAEVGGLDSERDVLEVREGGENRFVHHLPGRAKNPRLVLKRGLLVSESPLFTWCRDLLEGDLGSTVTTRDMMVALLDQRGQELMVWYVSQAWPVKWSVDRFNATESKLAMETLEFVYGSLNRFVARDLGHGGMFAP